MSQMSQMSQEKRYAVNKTIVVNTSQEKAFRVFTEGFNLWWPHAHHIGEAPIKKAVLEPKSGGRWYEIGEDGSECNWGKVNVYDPHQRIVLLWQITADWQFDANFVTEVEVKFVIEAPKRTRVELEHRNLERYGVKAVDMTETFGSPRGWTGMLEEYRRVAETNKPI